MDTNALTALLDLARQKSVVGPLGPNSVLIWTMILTGLAPTLASLAAWLKSKSVERIVNGERARMTEDIKTKDLRLVELEKSRAVMEERERLRDEADVRKEAVEIKAVALAEGKAAADKNKN